MSLTSGHSDGVRRPEELDSDAILKQGDELLRSSRALLDDLEEVVPAEDGSIDLTES